MSSPNMAVVSLPDLTAINRLVHRHVPEAVFLENIGQEVTYILPYSGARDGTFALLFKELDLEMGDLGVSTYGISDTTLEEVGDSPWTGGGGRSAVRKAQAPRVQKYSSKCFKKSRKDETIVLFCNRAL